MFPKEMPSILILYNNVEKLELLFGTKCVEHYLAAPEDAVCIVSEAKSRLIEAGWECTTSFASRHHSLTHICSSQPINEWMGLRDKALDFGAMETRVSQAAFKIPNKSLFGDKICCILLF
jgi:hypothetical protein